MNESLSGFNSLARLEGGGHARGFGGGPAKGVPGRPLRFLFPDCRLDSRLWKIQGQTSRSTGETVFSLVGVKE